jgi:hypothetical protein
MNDSLTLALNHRYTAAIPYSHEKLVAAYVELQQAHLIPLPLFQAESPSRADFDPTPAASSAPPELLSVAVKALRSV